VAAALACGSVPTRGGSIIEEAEVVVDNGITAVRHTVADKGCGNNKEGATSV